MKGPVANLLKPVASLRLTVTLFALAMFLIFAGTLAQVSQGVDHVVGTYFRSLFVWIPLQIFASPKVQKIIAQDRVPPGIPNESEQMHRNKDRIGANECEPEMSVAEALVEHASEDLRIPEVGSRKDRENRGDSHHQVEVPDDKVRSM